MPKILLVEFKNGLQKPEAYTSVPGFVERFPTYSTDKINYALSRLKKRYEDNNITITKIELHEREKV